MIRQPLQRFSQMQASDIDIYRRVTREKTHTMVRGEGGGGLRGGQGLGGVSPLGSGRAAKGLRIQERLAANPS
jgi:hypothetical protein